MIVSLNSKYFLYNKNLNNHDDNFNRDSRKLILKNQNQFELKKEI